MSQPMKVATTLPFAGKSTRDKDLTGFLNAHYNLPWAVREVPKHFDYGTPPSIPGDIQDTVKGLIIHYRDANRGARGALDPVLNRKQNQAAREFLKGAGPQAESVSRGHSSHHFRLELFEEVDPRIRLRYQAVLPNLGNRIRDLRFIRDVRYELRLTVTGDKAAGAVGGAVGGMAHKGGAGVAARMQAASPASSRTMAEAKEVHRARWFKRGCYLPFYAMVAFSLDLRDAATRRALEDLQQSMDRDQLWRQNKRERAYRGAKVISKAGGITGFGVATATAGAGPAAFAAPTLVGSTAFGPSSPLAAGQALASNAGGAKDLLGIRRLYYDAKTLAHVEKTLYNDKGFAPRGWVMVKHNASLRLTVVAEGI